MAHNLRPLTQYNEHDVINFFAYSGDSTLVRKGAAVKIEGAGFKADSTNPVEMLGNPGASYTNTVSQRYGAVPKVAAAVSGDKVVGLTLLDIRETDENGEKLIFNSRKAAEMYVIIKD